MSHLCVLFFSGLCLQHRPEFNINAVKRTEEKVEPHALALGTMKAFTLSFLCSRQEIINSSDRRKHISLLYESANCLMY